MFLFKFNVLRFLRRFDLFLWWSVFGFKTLIPNNWDSVDGRDIFDGFGLSSVLLKSLLVDGLFSNFEVGKELFGCGD